MADDTSDFVGAEFFAEYRDTSLNLAQALFPVAAAIEAFGFDDATVVSLSDVATPAGTLDPFRRFVDR